MCLILFDRMIYNKTLYCLWHKKAKPASCYTVLLTHTGKILMSILQSLLSLHLTVFKEESEENDSSFIPITAHLFNSSSLMHYTTYMRSESDTRINILTRFSYQLPCWTKQLIHLMHSVHDCAVIWLKEL